MPQPRSDRGLSKLAPELQEAILAAKREGQITGVEGYVESAATGIIAGINASMKFLGREMKPVPPESSIGSLINYISGYSGKNFQPININFGMYPELGQKLRKDKKREIIAKKALDSIKKYKSELSF